LFEKNEKIGKKLTNKFKIAIFRQLGGGYLIIHQKKCSKTALLTNFLDSLLNYY